VLFSSYAGTEVKNEGADEGFLILSEDEILGVVEA
jgi:co-chaperonin GroES (HSP10)